jgi:hypothetical protein
LYARHERGKEPESETVVEKEVKLEEVEHEHATMMVTSWRNK